MVQFLVNSGLWGQQCKSSKIAKENCALNCLSPTCYQLVYESDPVRIKVGLENFCMDFYVKNYDLTDFIAKRVCFDTTLFEMIQD